MKFFLFPKFMRRKRKQEILEAMLKSIQDSAKKKRCDICNIRFTKDMSRWDKSDFTSPICILCHKNYFGKKIKDYLMSYEREEIRKLKRRKNE